MQVALACHVPKDLATEKELSAKEWFDTVTKAMSGEVEVVEEGRGADHRQGAGQQREGAVPTQDAGRGVISGVSNVVEEGAHPRQRCASASASVCALCCLCGMMCVLCAVLVADHVRASAPDLAQVDAHCSATAAQASARIIRATSDVRELAALPSEWSHICRLQ